VKDQYQFFFAFHDFRFQRIPAIMKLLAHPAHLLPPHEGTMSPSSRNTMSDVWKPSVTVAAIIEHQGRFLLVEEETSDGIRLNQPAGHLDPNESLADAATRETREEAACEFFPRALVGVYMSRYVSSRTGHEVTYLRFAFTGELGRTLDSPLDEGILRTVWMTREEMQACEHKHRSPLVMRCVDDYLAGKRMPLSVLYTHPNSIGAPSA
jgi:8-oxo-dGTP pyrophosphatase MutT (NUDIX family)